MIWAGFGGRVPEGGGGYRPSSGAWSWIVGTRGWPQMSRGQWIQGGTSEPVEVLERRGDVVTGVGEQASGGVLDVLEFI